MAGGKPIDVVIDTDVDGVVSGAAKVADSFEDIQDSLKDTAKASDKASDGIEDDFKDAAKVIDRDLTNGALEEAADKAKQTGKTIGKSVKDGTDKAGEGFDDMKSEAASTAKETAASFGSIEDAAGALQEVAANAFAAFGPAGMAAGLMAAAGIGLAISALTDHADKINENKENLLSLAGEIRDVGGDLSKVDFVKRMQDWGLAIQDTKEWWELFQDDAKSGFEVIQEQSRKAGTSWTDAFKGAHGSMDDALTFLADTEDQYKDLNTEIDNAGGTVDEFGRTNSSASVETLKQRDALQEQRDAAQKNADAVRDANKHAWEANNLGKTQNDILREQIDLTNQSAGSKRDAIGADLDYADAQENTRTKLAETTAVYADNTKASRDKERAVLDEVDAINDWGQAQVDAGADVDETNAKMAVMQDKLAGTTTKFYGSKAAAEAHTQALLKTPKHIDTDVNVNGISDAEEKIRAFTSKGRHLYVDVHGNMLPVQNSIAGLNGTRISVDVAPRLGAGITN